MQPYYSDDYVTLYCGDCRDVLPQLAPGMVLLTDPPWGPVHGTKAPGVNIVQGNDRALDLWGEAIAAARTPSRVLCWLPCHADPRPWLAPVQLPYLRLVYLRRAIPGYYGRVLMDGEVIHVLGAWPQARKGALVIPGGLSITYKANDRHKGHPALRSQIAANWLVKWWTEPQDVVCDPFAGSGTTLVAAKSLGRKAVGIEIEEKYCEIAADRCSQEVLALGASAVEADK